MGLDFGGLLWLGIAVCVVIGGAAAISRFI